ncbi:MAG: MFS transporter [Actinobacteria bacterium]|nr:MFS transporter [Actinomycetota bacterium]
MKGSATERQILLATLLATGSIFIDISIVNVVLPDIRADLGTTLAEEQWIVNAYLVTMTAFVLPCGVLADVHGHRRLLQIGLALFAVATVLVGIAPDALFEIGARALQGVAAAIITPASVAILRTAIPPERQARAVGVWAVGTSLSAALGPVIGGVVGGLVGWRWAFLIVVPAVLASLAFSRAVPDTATLARRTDLVGGALAALAIAALVAGLIEWPVRGLTDPLVVGLLATGLVLGVAFAAHERRFPDPMLPGRAVRDRALNRVHVFTILAWSTPITAMLLISIRLQTAGGLGPTATGFALLPMSLVIAVLSKRLTERAAQGRMRLYLRAGPLVTAAGTLVALAIDPGRLWVAIVATLLMGLGMALLAGPVTHAVLQLSPPGDEGMQSAINLAAARFGTLLAVALIGIAAAVGWALAGGGAVPANPLEELGGPADGAYRAALAMTALFALAAVPFASAATRRAAAAPATG